MRWRDELDSSQEEQRRCLLVVYSSSMSICIFSTLLYGSSGTELWGFSSEQCLSYSFPSPSAVPYLRRKIGRGHLKIKFSELTTPVVAIFMQKEETPNQTSLADIHRLPAEKFYRTLYEISAGST